MDLRNLLNNISHILPDRLYLELKYYQRMHKKLNLQNPQTYNEKLQWLKLNYRKPLLTKLVDKYEVKEYVAKIIGAEYIIPTLGVWDNFDDIDFDKLPNQFVLKCTHDSGGIVICKNKAQFDRSAAKAKIERSLKRNYYWHGREWPYKNVKPRIIAEQYMEDTETSELRDYKFFSFNGETIALFIASDRQKKDEDTKFDFFDMDFKHIDVRNGHPNASEIIKKPDSFELMHKLADTLSKGFPHVRVDFYEVNGKVYFGEMTFSHWSGFTPFEPESFDTYLGEQIDLELVNKE